MKVTELRKLLGQLEEAGLGDRDVMTEGCDCNGDVAYAWVWNGENTVMAGYDFVQLSRSDDMEAVRAGTPYYNAETGYMVEVGGN